MELLAVVALLKSLPEQAPASRLGTVVENLASDVYEAEFSDDNGGIHTSSALRAAQLLKPHHEPRHQAAGGAGNGQRT
jgi:hypothetical protein